MAISPDPNDPKVQPEVSEQISVTDQASSEPQEDNQELTGDSDPDVSEPIHVFRFADVTFTPSPHRKSLESEIEKTSYRVGTVVDRKYKVETPLGSGNYCTVVLAKQLESDSRVALRFFRESIEDDWLLRGMIAHAFQKALILDNENVMNVVDQGFHGDLYYQVVEYISLDDCLAHLDQHMYDYGAPLLVSDVVGIGLDTCMGLEGIHRYGFVHRDIKPKNIVADLEKRHAKIIDLDFLLDPNCPTCSQLGAVGENFGTPSYMAPEQFDRTAQLDQRVDIFSLGATMFHLITGNTPFNYNRTNNDGTPQLACNPDLLNPGIPRALGEVIKKAMAERPEDRFQTARDLYNALLPFLRS